MGFFSNNCKECGHPMLSVMATNKINYWMENCVLIQPDGKFFSGKYDGYGRVTNENGDVNNFYSNNDYETQPLVYHERCWYLAGQPEKYIKGGSKMSEDQGWFFDEGDHDKPFPKEIKK